MTIRLLKLFISSILESIMNGNLVQVLLSLYQKSVAVGSGKGGVGKTTTAVNLAIYYARRQIRVGLIDLDPLSDIETLLGLADSESIFTDQSVVRSLQSFDEHKIKVFNHMDLIFPHAKLGTDAGVQLTEKLFIHFARELEQRYDILIFDLPAGVRYEDNLVFLEYIQNLVVVTNSEPTAHVAAGSYIKNVWELEKEIRVMLWHNKFRARVDPSFDPKDVIGNYNKNVPEELRINAREFSGEDIAFIPSDPSLDLLQGNPAVLVNIFRSIIDNLEVIQTARLSGLLQQLGLKGRMYSIIRYYLAAETAIGNEEKYRENLSTYLASVSGQQKKSPEQQALLKLIIKAVKADQFRNEILSLISLLSISIHKIEESKRPFALVNQGINKGYIDAKLAQLLRAISLRTTGSEFLKNMGCALVFHYALFKLFQFHSVLKLLVSFIPAKRNARGKLIRDKYTQIKNIVDANEKYQHNYFQLIKKMFPVLVKQIARITSSPAFKPLLFRDKNGVIKKEAYVKLLSSFIHDTLHSGLSIIVGFPYRPASVAFQEGADKLLGHVRNPVSNKEVPLQTT